MNDKSDEASVRAMLQERSTAVLSSDPPVREILRAGERRRLMFRGLIAVVAAASLAVVVGVGVTVAQRTPSKSGTVTASDGASSTPASDTPTPTEVESTQSSSPASNEYPSAEQCASLAPRELPNGAPPGDAQAFPRSAPQKFSEAWGSGINLVVVSRGQEALGYGANTKTWPPRDWPAEQVVSVGVQQRLIVPVGDPPYGEIAIDFVSKACPYVVTLNAGVDPAEPGLTLDEALDYAARF